MRVYLDICCLKRPFDSQEQALIRLESEAVASILSLPAERVTLIRSAAQILENDLNPVAWRRDAVATWLRAVPVVALDDDRIARRIGELMALGLKSFDAFHTASAEACADILVTVDDRFRKIAARLNEQLQIRIVSTIVLAQEVLEWKT